jgi:hypothetical protein
VTPDAPEGGESAVVGRRRPCRHGEQTAAVLAHLGAPTSLVLYRTPDRSRYAVQFTGPAGIGTLAAPPPSSELDIAQAALVQKAEELTHRRLDVLWHAPDQPDWWTISVTTDSHRTGTVYH